MRDLTHEAVHPDTGYGKWKDGSLEVEADRSEVEISSDCKDGSTKHLKMNYQEAREVVKEAEEIQRKVDK